MNSRRLGVTLLCGAMALALSGCVGEPEPTESTPAFASEEEAFAAAEEIYRAYNDASNNVDLSDPATFEPALRLTTGKLNESDRKLYSEWHADGWTQTGRADVVAIRPDTLSEDSTVATLAVCLDLSTLEVTDPSGASQVDPDRGATQDLLITLNARSGNQWLVENIGGWSGDPICES